MSEGFEKGRTHGALARARKTMDLVAESIADDGFSQEARELSELIGDFDDRLREHRGMRKRDE